MTAKDIILAVIAKIGIGGGTGHVVEYMGDAFRHLSMEGRMTVCNMSIEGGARAGMVAPDDTTFEYVYGRPFAPSGADWDAAVANWRKLPTDDGAQFDAEVMLDADELTPMITYGTNPGHGYEDCRSGARSGSVGRPNRKTGIGQSATLHGFAARSVVAWQESSMSSLSAVALIHVSPTCVKQHV